ncbi:MAG: ABC transporter ATP-binding protein [Spirochaetes bacterium]|nr:ABC transporter ATP-binding protein [Spirochaetota bacterium]
MLDARNIYAGYRGREVLKGISLTIETGEFIALIGPNGSGKSTFVKCITGYLSLQKGQVLLEGKDIFLWKGKERAKRIAVVAQEFESPLPFRVKDFIQLGRFPYRRIFNDNNREDRECIHQAMVLTGVEKFSQRKLTELSAGERQRVYLARALAQNPQLIVLDEPISHLDIGHMISIMDVLALMNKKGMGVVVVLHDVNIASDYAERIVALKDGKIFADGTPLDVITYQLIESLFDTVCVVKENPISSRPFVYPVPGRYRVGKLHTE